jgi:hypothetical protein
MKKSFAVTGVLVLGIGLVAVSMSNRSLEAEPKQEPARVLTVKQMMSGLVKPHKAALETALKAPPAGDEAWQALILNAALLNESGYLLMEDDRCPDKVWADASQALREESVTLLAALKSHDYDGSTAAFKNLTMACASCHKAHKK